MSLIEKLMGYKLHTGLEFVATVEVYMLQDWTELLRRYYSAIYPELGMAVAALLSCVRCLLLGCRRIIVRTGTRRRRRLVER